ncbi:hypothetical protein ACFPM0_13325 [Pseudonocardia sulfidoxydans]|uniref:hypothetical protein n=1 Tax=Pseudonocardia sulfidoxydans TaxID=54011 RepID=UPI0036096B92
MRAQASTSADVRPFDQAVASTGVALVRRTRAADQGHGQAGLLPAPQQLGW